MLDALIGFAAPAWRRLLVALVYALVVAAVVWAVEFRDRPQPAALVIAVPSDAAVVVLTAEATFPVAHWTVLVDGVAVEGQVDPAGWRGSVAGGEILVQAERADAADLSPGAVRLRAGGREVVAWGEGTVSVGMKLP
jgi:hypothetical protein